MPSVTQVLDAYQEPGIVAWKLSVGKVKAEAISKEALAIGTEVDAFIRCDIKSQACDDTKSVDAVRNCMKGWAKFKLKYPEYVSQVEDIQVELTKDDLMGHPDIIHKLEVSDIKSGNSLTLRPKYCVQASKYALLAKKDRAAIILLSKTNPNGAFLYMWWDGVLLQYFGQLVFDAFQTIFEYEAHVTNMVRKHLERERLA